LKPLIPIKVRPHWSSSNVKSVSLKIHVRKLVSTNF
jgi:hypothetical protein